MHLGPLFNPLSVATKELFMPNNRLELLDLTLLSLFILFTLWFVLLMNFVIITAAITFILAIIVTTISARVAILVIEASFSI